MLSEEALDSIRQKALYNKYSQRTSFKNELTDDCLRLVEEVYCLKRELDSWKDAFSKLYAVVLESNPEVKQFHCSYANHTFYKPN